MYTEHIKVNLANDPSSFKKGNGEGCWAKVTPEVKKLYDEDAEDGVYECELANDSAYYPDLKCGEIIKLEMRGEKRPVALYEELQKFRPEGYDWRKVNDL